ncbi:DUF192 domain-containing protein [Ponticaulis sp.]|uniref:DUF192 domain-containing protein n=1 Tax=Ponticaulis sp. TaxID=2020902 RepID=UPI000B6C9899|nr:DUF192 domain-containing protein [Ponticaulis sp.]MAI89366.1 hypothetical protein [Ponticaulis sp.]OUY00407.1 MAG: hypothetical protein CBB65_02890 [Hyphomonadaceae bacterium TMED5]|tara:strand:+ start:3950 stop:4456 length:507 start_codon:yes stop_codon:yes gene_type:complete
MKNILLASALFALIPAAQAQSEALYMPESSITIETAGGDISLTVEVADDPEETATGLMFREGIADDHGMIFDFGIPREPNMYMRNVPFAIDMVFMNEEGVVMAITAHAQPFSERHINPGFPVKSVLELADGQAAAFGIRPGDVIRHEIFGNAVEPAATSEVEEEAIEE